MIAADTGSWDWVRLRARCLREARRVLPRAEAEEAVQEALVRAWMRRDACRTPERPLPWVLEITRNEARRTLERRARRHAPAALRLSEPVAHHDATERLALATVVRRLESADRRVLWLRYSEDLTHAEVARRLGLPIGTVKVRLHRARGRLRAMLEEESLSPTGATRSA